MFPLVLLAIGLGALAAFSQSKDNAVLASPPLTPDPTAPPKDNAVLASQQLTPGPTPPPEPAVPLEAPQMARSTHYEQFLSDYARTPFYSLIAAAETRYGLPTNLLARQLWAESRFDANAIGPDTSSGSAKGIAQFVDATAQSYGIDAFDAPAAIDTAAKYDAWLYSQTSDWYAAMVGYNWGVGHVQRSGVDKAPTESVKYASGILADSEA